MSKSIEEVLKFLLVLEMTKANPKNKLPAAIEFEKGQQSELKLYLKEVKKLLQQTNKHETNKEKNDDMEEEEEQSEDELKETKKRPRDHSKNSGEESSNDKESTTCENRSYKRDSLSLEQRKDMAILNFIEQVQKGQTRESTKSRTKWENWTKTLRKTVLALLSRYFKEEPEKYQHVSKKF